MIGAALSIPLFKINKYFKRLPIYFLVILIVMAPLLFEFNVNMLIITFLVFGIIKNLITVGGNQMTSYIYTKFDEITIINHVQFVYGIGTFLSPIIVGKIFEYLDVKKLTIFFIILIIINIIFLVIINIYLKPSSNKLEQSGNKLEQSGNKLEPSGNKLEPSGNKLIIMFIISFFILYSGYEIFIGTWGTFLVTNKFNDSNFSYICNSIFWLSLSMTKLMVFPLTKRNINEKKVVNFSILISVVFTFIFKFSSTKFVCVLSMVGLGFSLGNIVPSTMKHLTNSGKVNHKETAWCFVGAGFGGIIFSRVYSYLLNNNINKSFNISILQLILLSFIFYILNFVIGKEKTL